MAEDDRRKKKKKKKKSKRRAENGDDVEAGDALPIESGEAEFASSAYTPDGGELHGSAEVAALMPTDEDLIPAPIEEPDMGEAGGQEFNEDGLAVAMAVDAGDEDEYIYAAIEYDPDSKPPLHKNRRFRVYTCIALIVVVAVVGVVVVYVTKSAKGTQINDQFIAATPEPTRSPTKSPVTDREQAGIIEQIEAGVLQRGANFSVIERDDPRFLALDWILHYDQMQLESDDVNLYQRYVLALLAFNLESVEWFNCGRHMNIGPNGTENFVNEDCIFDNPSTGQKEDFKIWLSSTDECDWFGVICSSDGVVRGLELIGNELIGQIPPEISQLRFLQYLALNGNCLHGTIPAEFGTMPNLLSLELQGNGLSGEVPNEIYSASKLQLLNVAMQFQYAYTCKREDGSQVNTLYAGGDPANGYNWGLQGQILGPEVATWRSMKGLHIFSNSFDGTIADEIGDLKYLVFLRAQNNAIAGMIPSPITRLSKLRELMLGKNEIYSDLPPDIGNMEDLEDLRVTENEMFGGIPNSLYQLKKLKKLWLEDTLKCEEIRDEKSGNLTGYDCDMSSEYGFDGPISSEIGNLSRLSHLIINNNPLTGTVPSEIGQCEALSVLHMHQTKITGTIPDDLCLLRDKNLNSESGTGILYADCRPNNRTEDPFVSCSCCSDCCDHTTQVCVADD
mmetsp:Transcript_12391/g.26946  ORF Transcript_12391/g.26946 Transcript_12391/m.26946 type:complete len:675 (-) Transcript_12391:1237-3261(-)